MTRFALFSSLTLVATLALSACSDSENKKDGGPGSEPTSPANGDSSKSASDLPDELAKLDPGQGLTIAKTNCGICHDIMGQTNSNGTGKTINKAYVENQLARMKSYEEQIATIQERYPDKYASSKATYDHILAAEDPRVRFVRWLPEYVKKPTFDRSRSLMSPMGFVKKEHVEQIAAWMLSLEK